MSGRFSIGEALGSGFTVIRRRPWAVLAWGALMTVPAILSLWLVLGLFDAFGVGVLEAEEPSPQAFAAMMQFQAGSWALNILQMLIYVLLITGIARAVFYPERRGRFFDLRLGMDEVRVAVTGLAFILGFYAAVLILALLAVAVGAALWSLSKPAGVGIGVLVAIAGGVGIAWAALRASLIMPASVALGDFAFVQGWRMTRGQAWRLLGLTLALVAVVLLIELAIMAVAILIAMGFGFAFWSQLGAWFDGVDPQAAWNVNWTLVLWIGLLATPFVAALYGAITAISVAPYASACRQLLAQTGRDETAGSALS